VGTLLHNCVKVMCCSQINWWGDLSLLLCLQCYAFSALTLLVGGQEEHPAREKLSDGTGMVIYLECGANDLHMVQLMPLPPHHLLLQ